MNLQLPVPEMITTWQFWVVAVCCFILSEVLKLIPFIKDNAWIINLANVLFGILLLGAICGFSGENILFGILASAASTLAWEVYKNILSAIVGTKPELDTKAGGTDD